MSEHIEQATAAPGETRDVHVGTIGEWELPFVPCPAIQRAYRDGCAVDSWQCSLPEGHEGPHRAPWSI